jgi:hypothetical protein
MIYDPLLPINQIDDSFVLLQKQTDKDGGTITVVGISFVLINLHDKARVIC